MGLSTNKEISGIINQRNSSMELLRIIAMIMIVLHHLTVHGWFYFDAVSMWIPEIWLNTIAIWWTIWNNIFVFISWYFLIKSNLNWKKYISKLLKLLLQVIFYSIMSYIICIWIITWFSNMTFQDIIDLIIPFNEYRFFDAYILLYLLVPFLNKGLLQLTPKRYRTLIVVLVLMNIIMLNFLYFEWSNLFWFITMYVISSYIRLYWLRIPIKSCFIYSIFSCFIAVSIVLLNRLSMTGYDGSITLYQYKNYNVFLVIASFLLFLAFTKVKVKNNKKINMLASATFGVYLIHENHLVASFLWTHVFNVTLYQSSLLIIPYSILTALFVYLMCSIIDIIRQRTIEQPILKLIDKCYAPLNKLLNTNIHILLKRKGNS